MNDDPNISDRDDERLLRVLDAAAPPPDAARLAALRQQSLAAFLSTPVSRTLGSVRDTQRKPPMLSFALRGFAVAAAALAGVAVWLGTIMPTSVSGAAPPFSKILDELRSAATLHLELVKASDSAQILVRAPGLVRKEHSPQRYEIAAGSRWWKVDESTNTVTTGDSPWFVQHDQQIDLVGLLDVGVKDASKLLAARPVGREQHDGRECLVYRVQLPTEKDAVEIDAYADAANRQLVALQAVRRAGRRQPSELLGELRLVAMNVAAPDDKFTVATSLTEDGRIGKITDAQGIVVLRPLLARRWTPVARETLLKPGDWLRTELRGANAVKVKLSSEVELTLGPGTLVECISPAQARLHTGEVQVSVAPSEGKTAFELLAPREGAHKFKPGEKQLVWLTRDEKLFDVSQTPIWLAGFEGATNQESIGSLIVNLPDGRNEPLAVGYHKVSVEIRDQIARTTIEESFVNHTPARLEGVFHFPLPQDASISGFGMWIGNDLIEADVVEKQRAREIYETILRENRDPGLLEWTGGNIFKARVFPIEASSEKRVKIVYTQVLPLRANRYRYSYALHSELLRTRPLRELSLTVTVNSALPLKSVSCPTHAARMQQTAHSAQVEFAAQEYSPTRDFEVICEIDGRQSDVVVIPHRRGEDGYFLVQLTPPSPAGNWQRELLPDGQPLSLVLLCDTSASMDAEKRKQQTEFVGTVLATLGDDDRFLLAAADVGTAWAFPEPVAATAENVAKAKSFLEERLSLGWTNLDRAFADVLEIVPVDAQIIYIGDGIVTAGDTDPAAFVKRLQRNVDVKSRTDVIHLQRLDPVAARDTLRNLFKSEGNRAPTFEADPQGRRLLVKGTPDQVAQINDLLRQLGEPGVHIAERPSLHAITVGNSYESVVMKGIAAIGGGSVRSIGGEQTPQAVALELLNEIAQPGLRDVNVQFRGLKVAAVYPERLPNVPAGTQQILVGRYLPEGNDQHGEIVITGRRGNETVRYAAQVNLADAEAGNSFIPRLWARSHLDQLLAQGQSAAVRDQIIALSEEYHIITPYTSLLVLETDADRERFGVKRRYEMRDGERFFATGKDNANYELLQQQMKRAGDWRLGLRRQVLHSLIDLGRNPQILQQQVQAVDRVRRSLEYNLPVSRAAAPMGGPATWYFESGGFMGRMSGGLAGGAFNGEFSLGDVNGDFSALYAMDPDESKKELKDLDDIEELSLGLKVGEDRRKMLKEVDDKTVAFDDFERADRYGLYDALPALAAAEPIHAGLEFGYAMPAAKASLFSSFGRGATLLGRRNTGAVAYDPYGHRGVDYLSWLNELFPTLPEPPTKPIPQPDPAGWSADAVALSKSLLRTEALQKLDGGIELRRATDGFDPRWSRRSYRSTDLALYSPTAWLTRPFGPTDHTIIQFCNAQERGAFSLAFQLGRVRASVKEELAAPPLSLSDFSLSPLHESYRGYQTRVEPAGDNKITLILTVKESSSEERYTIDSDRHVVLKRDTFQDGKHTSATTFDDFVELAGGWWAKKITTADDKGRTTSVTTLELTQHGQLPFAQRIAAELATRQSTQFLRQPSVKLKVARQKVADGSATFDDRVTMILHNAALQQWDGLWKHVDAAEQLAAGKPGVCWMRTLLLATIRRNDDARKCYLDEAQRLAANRQQDEMFLAEFLLNHAYGTSGWPEFLEFVNALKPVYERQPAELDVMPQWQERLAQCDDALNRQEDALAIRRAKAVAAPWQLDWQIDVARRLSLAGQVDAAFAWLHKELDRQIERTASEDESLRTAVADVYRQQGRWADLLKFTAAWIARNPTSQSWNSAYAQHLSALVFNDRLDDANALAEQWLRAARVDRRLTPAEHARLDAALHFAEGNAYNLSFQRMDERWFQPISETTRFFLRHKHHPDIATRGFGNHYFNQSDAADRLRGEFLKLLQADLATLTPPQINLLVNWTLSGRIELPQLLNGRKQLDASEVPNDVWKQIAAELKPRWLAAQKEDKHLFGEALRTIYANRFAESDLLPFLRERIAAADAEYKTAYTTALFDVLLTTSPWTDAIEQQAFALLPQLSEAQQPVERLAVLVPALHRLDDAAIANRHSTALRQFNDRGEQDKLTRQEVAEKKAAFRTDALAAVADRLSVEAAKEQGPLAAWLRMEHTWLDMQLDRNFAQVEGQCWQTLGEVPPKPVADDAEVTEAESRQHLLDGLLKQRAFTTVMNLAVRRKADPRTIDRVQKYIDAGIGQGGDAAAVWRGTKFRFLVALDRPDDLDRALREWIRTDVFTAPWRQMLARLVAERGKLDEAIQLFEACEKDKLLTAADYRLLGDWHLVSNRRAAYERSRIESFKQMPEHQLANMFYQVRNRWYRHDVPLPSELDENTLFAMKALFEKSASPENYLWQLRDLYGACRDFRLLQMLPDAVLGRSPQQAYAFLQNLHSQVLYELRNEATADEILARVRTLRESSPAAFEQPGCCTATDLRALDLLEAVVERKSSEVLNQPGPHVIACLAALQRAFQRDWAAGEPVQMASFLYHLGGMHDHRLVEEQLRELRELLRRADANSRDHLLITNDLANALFWYYGKHDESLREMETEVRAYEQAHQGLWPHRDNQVLASYISLYEGATRHAAGEAVLLKYLAKPEHDEQSKWLKDRLMSLYNHALEHKGTVTQGEGATLFQNIIARSLKELAVAPDENVRQNIVSRMATTYDIAQRNKLPGVADAVSKFAFETIPVVLKQQQSQYRSTANAPLHVIGEALGSTGALRYIVERMEQYPQRLDLAWENAWQVFGYELARRREEVSNARLDWKDLEPRVLKLAVRELKRELRSGESRSRYIYCNHHSYFWNEKAADFARAAEEVLAERKSSGRRVATVANYLWNGLDLYPRAIEILLVAHRDGLLDEGAQAQLVNWLHSQSRHAESIALLEPLITMRPDNMQYRTLLMSAYHRSSRPEQLAEVVVRTDAHFHQQGRWIEGNISQFARGCATCNLHDRAIGYFKEAIALHQREHPGSGLNDLGLSSKYQDLAGSHSALGQTKEAVDAASAAIICWGSRTDQRRDALERLKQVFAAAKDLDDYVQHLDAEAAKTGQDSPILRKAIGQTWQSRSDHLKSIAQLQLAAALQPNDREIQQALIAEFDATQNAAAAMLQLLKLIDLNRHDLALYLQLAERMKNNEAEAERAATSIVESSPNEAENHAALAELRQKQNRWDAAIPHWKQVAELRRLEPTGLVKLAEAQVHEKQWDAAQETITILQRTEWPSRFNDVQNQVLNLQRRLPK